MSDGTKPAAELLREIAAADPEAHNRALARGYGVGSVTGVIVLDFRPFADAMTKLAREVKRSAARLAEYFRRQPHPAAAVPLHGFTPNFDLACTVCGVGPEECRGGRP